MESLVDTFNVTLLTGPAPSVMLLRSLNQRQRRRLGKGKSFQFTAGRVGSTKSGGVADETLQNHHPSLLSLPVVSSRHKPAPGQTPPVPDQEQSPLPGTASSICFLRGEGFDGGINSKDKARVLGHRSSSFRRFRCPHACRPLSTVSRGRHRVTLGDIRASVPVHGVVGTVPEGADATTPSLSRFTGACL